MKIPKIQIFRIGQNLADNDLNDLLMVDTKFFKKIFTFQNFMIPIPIFSLRQSHDFVVATSTSSALK